MGEGSFLRGFAPPPELRLILVCLRLNPDVGEIRQIQELSRVKINWPEFLFWVDHHRVAPLVYQNLRRHTDNGALAPVIRALQSRFESNARRGLANTAELVRLYKLFQENGISTIPLKGSILARQVYGNLALRHAGDIDLLIDSGQVDAADRLLQTSYRRVVPSFRLTPAQQRRFLRLMHHFEYYQTQGQLRVELHWRALHDQPPHIMKGNQFHRRGSTVAVAGSRLPALSLAENLLYLSGHGACHFWFRLFWLLDLAEIIRQHPEIDWQQVLALAQEAGLVRPMALGVLLAHELLAVPLPKLIRTYVRQDRVIAAAAKFSCRSMLCPDPYNQPLAMRLHLQATKFNFAFSIRNKLKILQEFFAGRDFTTDGLPDSLFFLYYLLRFPLWLQRWLDRNPNRGNRLPTAHQRD
jgi:hypothetical protein